MVGEIKKGRYVYYHCTGYKGNCHEPYVREEVLECHLVSGDFDYLIKARIREMAEYRKLLGDMLLQLPGAAQSKSYVVMEEIKETLALSMESR